MKVSMADVNKKANTIINQVAESGEVAIIYKHGKPIAEIRPIRPDEARSSALAYLAGIEPTPVDTPIDDAIEAGRRRSL